MSKGKNAREIGRIKRQRGVNSLFTIRIYKWNTLWVFDDPLVGLKQEPFVAGSDDIITKATEKMTKLNHGVVCVFSDGKFPTADLELVHRGPDEQKQGDYYDCPQFNMQGWLCPALRLYFPDAPKRIFAKFYPASAS